MENKGVHMATTVYKLPVDFLLGEVRPVDDLVWHVNVQSHSIFKIGDDQDVVTVVHRNHPHIMFVCEVQHGHGA